MFACLIVYLSVYIVHNEMVCCCGLNISVMSICNFVKMQKLIIGYVCYDLLFTPKFLLYENYIII